MSNCLNQGGPWPRLWGTFMIESIEVGRSAHCECHHSLGRVSPAVEEWGKQTEHRQALLDLCSRAQMWRDSSSRSWCYRGFPAQNCELNPLFHVFLLSGDTYRSNRQRNRPQQVHRRPPTGVWWCGAPLGWDGGTDGESATRAPMKRSPLPSLLRSGETFTGSSSSIRACSYELKEMAIHQKEVN